MSVHDLPPGAPSLEDLYEAVDDEEWWSEAKKRIQEAGPAQGPIRRGQFLVNQLPPGAPPFEGLYDAHKRFKRHQRWWTQHWDELKVTHPEQFVAVLDGEICAAGRHLEPLLDELQLQGLFPDHEVSIEFIATEPRI
jgi:hypothetical protein